LKILILGYSKLVKKRILNYFKKKNFSISIASISHKDKIKNILKQYNSYDTALKNSKADIVYISLPNSMHFEWAFKALKLNYHVIVDKPICDTNIELNKLINLSYKKNKLLSEATFFNYHSQFEKLKKNINNLEDIKKIRCDFVIPMPKKNSILRSNLLKGGVLMDMGPYASSIARIFLKEKIFSKKVTTRINKNTLITSIKFVIRYKTQTYSGKFQFGGKYSNRLIIYFKNSSLTLNRVFSPPADQNLEIIRINNKVIFKEKIKKDDCFKKYFNEVITKIKKKDYDFFIDQMRFDNNFRNKVLKSKTSVKKSL
jgi:dTDP-3,4-didehydro-2,6-dideoxy-alpha-D-glucose 3-reductase